jgi:glycosyltransferase involved in cell wall biosynthesis
MLGATGVHHHVLLERRGGAVKVARTLARVQSRDRPVSLSFEVDEPGDAAAPVETFRMAPGDLAVQALSGRVVHAHATRDWPELLTGFITAPRPLVITSHDASLVTGGCVYPAFCPKHGMGCPDPCPRLFPESELNRAIKRDLVARARPVLVSPSAWLAGLLRREWPKLTIKVIPNGVDIPQTLIGKDQARVRLGVSTAARVALFLAHGGARAAYKGGDRIEVLLQKIAALAPGTLGIVAGGDETSRGETVLNFPYVEGELLSTLLRAADLLVYPSIADNHPLVVLEAMAHGLAVAAYGAGGIPEQIIDHETGRVLPVLDEEGLARAAAEVLSAPTQIQALGDKARRRALRHFQATRMAQDYDKVYARAAQAHTASETPG